MQSAIDNNNSSLNSATHSLDSITVVLLTYKLSYQ